METTIGGGAKEPLEISYLFALSICLMLFTLYFSVPIDAPVSGGRLVVNGLSVS